MGAAAGSRNRAFGNGSSRKSDKPFNRAFVGFDGEKLRLVY
jgi:hypothetical protein